MDADNERQVESGNKGVQNGRECARLKGGTFNNQQGSEVLMECRGGGAEARTRIGGDCGDDE